MSWKKFFFGIGVGFAAAYLLIENGNKRIISSEEALTLAKNTFKKNGEISGSWIQINPETYTKNGSTYQVYKGGICYASDSEPGQYEFMIDALTGTILETNKL